MTTATTQSKIPKSNGYGSFNPEIIVRVDRAHAQHVKDTLAVSPFRTSEDDSYSDFKWVARAPKRGDDEYLVYYLGHLLNDIPHDAYKIMWDESKY